MDESARIRIRLVSSDGQVFEVDKKAVSGSLTIMKKLQLRLKSDHDDNDNHNSPVVLDGIAGETLKKIIEYCNHHNVPYSTLEDEAVINSLHAFDSDFMNVDQTTHFTLIKVCLSLSLTRYFCLFRNLVLIFFKVQRV